MSWTLGTAPETLGLLVIVCVFDYTFTTFCLPQEEIGFSMKILDIGGGFSGSETQLELVSIFLSAF